MKIRYIVLIYTVFIGVVLGAALGLFNNLASNEIDILELNQRIIEVENELNNHNNESQIEADHHCEIIFFSDSTFAQVVNKAIKNQDIIIDYLDGDTLVAKIIFPNISEEYEKACQQTRTVIIIIVSAVLVLGYGLIAFIYYRFIRPFKKLDNFAASISAGNFDIPLFREKHDYFGAFTEAFDSMREALKRAKEGEFQANKSKKELIASLSHDIKTPVSSIIAICELLNVKVTDADILKNIQIIDSKAKIIDSLMNNMFSAALEDLCMLQIHPTEEQTLIIPNMFEDLNYHGLIHFENQIPEFLIYCDRLRLNQVIDNIINNSYKYANTIINVSYKATSSGLNIIIRDSGPGAPENDLPLVFGKFYRGENASKTSGSGLGLYLAKYFMTGMEGDIVCENDHGFVVTIFLKKI